MSPKKSAPTRRRILQSASTGLVAGVLGSMGMLRSAVPANAADAVAPKRYQGHTLRVFVYSGAWEKTFREYFVPRFEAQTGAQVVVDPGWWDSIPKLKASPPGQPAFDLVLTDATQGFPAIKEGLFQTLDMAKLPNKTNFAASALDNWVVKDGYGITFPDSVMTLGYNKTMLGFEPSAWSDLLRDDVSGKLGMYNSFYMSLYTFACMKASQEGKAGTAAKEVADNLQGVIDFAKANRGRVKLWWPTSTDMALNLQRKNCALGNMHSNDMLPALKSSPDLGAVVPETDRAFVLLMWVIPTGTKETDLAHEAINLLLSEDVQIDFARQGAATAVPAAAAKIAAEDKFWAQIYPSDAASLASVQYYPYDTYIANWDELVKVWDRQILRNG